jgi:hypothetical protein
MAVLSNVVSSIVSLHFWMAYNLSDLSNSAKHGGVVYRQVYHIIMYE